ncbi:hypothetical protein HanRHA438_Chr16g0755981 [Helianthus annuus]|nr:hypothetical protein HanHA300_Chr16g0606811 [Helianthus annuus]KAJ0442401.1 hypothetical protein HanIR_Chr16g0808821 [Helianthus annuus]KAJ0460161.1 hypothetical protein HanHA89_Chr16g0657411 [Helianthus annuus]KAJ0640601.1 hypothetical protein HanLR1_Chr16g0617411 [Helianthus annuus]KAJ0644528.1 hypothetical protein HanOQP8_Chr16g0613191 [Helianthus annuus]
MHSYTYDYIHTHNFIVLILYIYQILYLYLELIAKIVPDVWAHLPFSSKMTLLYHFAPHVCNFLSFSSKPLT